MAERSGVGRAKSAVAGGDAQVTREQGRALLRVAGVIQSVAVDECHEPDVWDAMIPARRPAAALILGMGGGTIAALLTRRFGPLPIVGVEHDPRIVHLARESFGMRELPHVQIVVEDAISFVRQCRASFDLICVDLYTGGKLAHGVLDASFLRAVSQLLSRGGVITINLWASAYLPDHLRRIQRVLPVHDVVEVGGNVVVHCRRWPGVIVAR
ncbi:MAG TPA: methyltransferase domain-containing protein [Ktedonobacterales bacterium]|nr:methyltransferase domain-containing protein [Ktedonobacterales bacterium]